MADFYYRKVLLHDDERLDKPDAQALADLPYEAIRRNTRLIGEPGSMVHPMPTPYLGQGCVLYPPGGPATQNAVTPTSVDIPAGTELLLGARADVDGDAPLGNVYHLDTAVEVPGGWPTPGSVSAHIMAKALTEAPVASSAADRIYWNTGTGSEIVVNQPTRQSWPLDFMVVLGDAAYAANMTAALANGYQRVCTITAVPSFDQWYPAFPLIAADTTLKSSYLTSLEQIAWYLKDRIDAIYGGGYWYLPPSKDLIALDSLASGNLTLINALGARADILEATPRMAIAGLPAHAISSGSNWDAVFAAETPSPSYFDEGNMWSVGSPTKIFRASGADYDQYSDYLIVGQVGLIGNASAAGNAAVRLMYNGGGVPLAQQIVYIGNSEAPTIQVSGVVRMPTPGDYFTVNVLNNTGYQLTVDTVSAFAHGIR